MMRPSEKDRHTAAGRDIFWVTLIRDTGRERSEQNFVMNDNEKVRHVY
jgi:hypothetical protein